MAPTVVGAKHNEGARANVASDETFIAHWKGRAYMLRDKPKRSSTIADNDHFPVLARTPAADAQTRRLLRVLIASQVRLFQDGIAALLEQLDCVRVIGKTNLLQAAVQTAELQPDVVLFDATRPANLELVKPLTAQIPAPKVVAFGIAEGDAEIVALATAGIAGYTRDDAAPEDVVTVLASAMRDELLCSPRAAATLSHHVALLARNGGHGGSTGPALSRRELEITDLIDRGLSNKHIAGMLGIQATTVKNHVHNILEKLKVHRRGEAAACIRAKLRRQRPARGSEAPPAKRA
jgi:DNA-binding NarL/FixJ family response regulator